MHSMAVGAYLRRKVDRAVESSVYVMQNGKGQPVSNPFGGEALTRKAAPALLEFAHELAQRGLNRDTKFMTRLAEASRLLASTPMEELISDLAALEEHGDGGPDPEFSLRFADGGPVLMQEVQAGFKKRGKGGKG